MGKLLDLCARTSDNCYRIAFESQFAHLRSLNGSYFGSNDSRTTFNAVIHELPRIDWKMVNKYSLAAFFYFFVAVVFVRSGAQKQRCRLCTGFCSFLFKLWFPHSVYGLRLSFRLLRFLLRSVHVCPDTIESFAWTGLSPPRGALTSGDNERASAPPRPKAPRERTKRHGATDKRQ